MVLQITLLILCDAELKNIAFNILKGCNFVFPALAQNQFGAL